MAVDTASRRASCIGFDFPSVHVWPVPDGTIGQPDRQHVAYKYPGVLAPVVVVEALAYIRLRVVSLLGEAARRGEVLGVKNVTHDLLGVRTGIAKSRLH